VSSSIAIIGAGPDRSKFGNKAVRAYQKAGYQVFPVHPSADAVEGLPAYRSVRDVPVTPIDRISVYLPPAVTLAVLDDIAAVPAGEVWLNPGSYDGEVLARAAALGLPVVRGCSILDVGINPHEL
jgi:predicted CoA-binding protein